MVLRCRDTGGWCNWEGRADIAEDLIEMASRHAEGAHYVKATREFRETARMRIRDEVAEDRSPSSMPLPRLAVGGLVAGMTCEATGSPRTGRECVGRGHVRMHGEIDPA